MRVLFGAWKLILGGILVGLAVGGGLLIYLRAGEEAPTLALFPAQNETASDFTLDTLEGQSVRLSDYQGRVVVLNFWVTWCGPCQAEMPLLQAAADAHPDGLTVLGVNFQEGPETVRPYAEELGLTFPLLLDSHGRVEGLYRVRAFPTTFFIDPHGKLRFTHIGELSAKQLEAYLTQLGVPAS